MEVGLSAFLPTPGAPKYCRGRCETWQTVFLPGLFHRPPLSAAPTSAMQVLTGENLQANVLHELKDDHTGSRLDSNAFYTEPHAEWVTLTLPLKWTQVRNVSVFRWSRLGISSKWTVLQTNSLGVWTHNMVWTTDKASQTLHFLEPSSNHAASWCYRRMESGFHCVPKNMVPSKAGDKSSLSYLPGSGTGNHLPRSNTMVPGIRNKRKAEVWGFSREQRVEAGCLLMLQPQGHTPISMQTACSPSAILQTPKNGLFHCGHL